MKARLITAQSFAEALFLGAALLLCAGGCNSVLGIEKAHLDPTWQATGGMSAGGSSGISNTAAPATFLPVTSCGPETGCGTCLNSCSPQSLGNCLADQNCREALDSQRVCLGSSCTDNGCVEEQLFDYNELATCALGACSATCGAKPLASMCELLCACLQHNCGDTDATCVEHCNTLDPDLAYCRFKHCQFAPLDAIHCDHAKGLGQCDAPLGGNTCRDLAHSGFPCITSSDCCSGSCVGQICN